MWIKNIKKYNVKTIKKLNMLFPQTKKQIGRRTNKWRNQAMQAIRSTDKTCTCNLNIITNKTQIPKLKLKLTKLAKLQV